jgi:hypothetical protein
VAAKNRAATLGFSLVNRDTGEILAQAQRRAIAWEETGEDAGARHRSTARV